MRLEQATARFGPRCPSCFSILDPWTMEMWPEWDEEGNLTFEQICAYCSAKFHAILEAAGETA